MMKYLNGQRPAIMQGLILAILIFAFVYFAVVTTQQNVLLQGEARAAARTETALCVLKEDLVTRNDASIAFLKDHPHGIPGIPVEQIQQSIDNQERTILALSLLECP